MRNLKFLLLLFFTPLFGFCQNLTGIWTGTLSNDSSTVRKDQSFEIALTENGGKVYGYAYSTFIVNDTLYYIIKKLKGNVNGNICEVKDDEVLTHNFNRNPEKGVNVIYTFRYNQQEIGWTIDGNWKTSKTKEYYSISGDVNVRVEKDLSKSKLYEHLGDLNLQNTLVFDKSKEFIPETKSSKEMQAKKEVVQSKTKPADNRSEKDIVKQNEKNNTDKKAEVTTDEKASDEIVKTEKKSPNGKESKEIIAKTEVRKPEAKTETVITEQKPIENKLVTDIAKTEVKKPEAKKETPDQKTTENKQAADIAKTEVKRPEVKKEMPEQKPTENKQVADIAKTEVKKPEVKKEMPEQKPTENKQVADIAKTEVKKEMPEQKPADNKQVADIAKTEVKKPEEKKTAPEFIFNDLKRSDRVIKLGEAMVEERATIPSETIYFKSDSLVLALYDNGEIDGDTVSVILNGELIIEKQGLKSSAFKKTIYLAPDGTDSILLVLFAENLGIYPPNTGLLIVKDGDESYYVRFNADYSKNAAILLRRKLK